MTAMDEVADTNGNGRALWEPSSGEPDAINSYGTSLALELLPYFTHGRIGSMEGIYFESSATTSYHFLTVAECSEHPSNPVRGLVYGNPGRATSTSACGTCRCSASGTSCSGRRKRRQGGRSRDSRWSRTSPESPLAAAEAASSDWKVYEVANSDLVVGMDQVPVVAKLHGGDVLEVLGQAVPRPDHRRAPAARVGVHGRAVVDRSHQARHRVRAVGPPELAARRRPRPRERAPADDRRRSK